ncbi:MAG TPA: helix-hairpin-helix domain-containing protein [Pyrinomonadaceae bacterium]|nr:helix-hairpin-helix domain-containing protein [Pyrinomonadaceae bacterium]
MKQNLPPAKFQSPLIKLVILAAILSASACATLPRPTNSATRLSPDLSRAEQASAININTASPQELEKLPGIGQGIAERITAHREQYGPFRRPEHLMMVRGISDRKFRELRAMIVVE